MMFVGDLGTVDTNIRVWEFPVQLGDSRSRCQQFGNMPREGTKAALSVHPITTLPDRVTKTFFMILHIAVEAVPSRRRHLLSLSNS